MPIIYKLHNPKILGQRGTRLSLLIDLKFIDICAMTYSNYLGTNLCVRAAIQYDNSRKFNLGENLDTVP